MKQLFKELLEFYKEKKCPKADILKGRVRRKNPAGLGRKCKF
jgi:hypothetical protein